MKRIKLIATLLAAFILMMAMTSASYANSYSFTGNCSYDGEKITADFDDQKIDAAVSGLEPGDTLTYEITYTNNSKETTEWYMKNSVIETLEDSKDQAENGGYAYVLKNIGPLGKKVTTLFDNSEVGGEVVIADLVGLRQATNATGDYFFIQELAPGESATTHLEVGFDGETEVNDYMDTSGVLMVQYAVEKQGEPGTIVVFTPKTGDTSNMMMFILLMTAALLVAILAIISWRRSRKHGGEQA